MTGVMALTDEQLMLVNGGSDDSNVDEMIGAGILIVGAFEPLFAAALSIILIMCTLDGGSEDPAVYIGDGNHPTLPLT